MAGVAMMDLPPQQARLHRFIVTYARSSGKTPTYDLMKMAMGLKSKASIHRLICALEENGLVERSGDRRGFRILAESPLELYATGDLIAELDRRSALPAYVDTHEGLSA